MKRLRASLVAALAAALVTPIAAVAAEVDPSDRVSLLRLAEAMDRAWMAADAGANADLFAVDATARFGTDPIAVGRAAIRDQFVMFFKDRPPNLRHVTAIERIARLSVDLAMWDAEVRVEEKQADGRWNVLTRIRNVTVISRVPAGWRIKAVRAYPVR